MSQFFVATPSDTAAQINAALAEGWDIAGRATNSLIVNANNTLIDDIWAWRADHGNSGTVGWTVNTAAHGLVVNGANVLATGLFVEHYQNYRPAHHRDPRRPGSPRRSPGLARRARGVER
jgi:hypothetical protein